MEGLSLVTLEDQIANMGNATQRLPPAENSANRDQEEIIHKYVLSLDIWALIFEELSIITDDLCSYRLICRRLDGIIIPFVFKTSRITEIILSNPEWRLTAELVKDHGRRLVFVEKDLDWDEVAKFINECRYVQDIEWNLHTDLNTSFPAAIRQVLEHDKPHIQFHLTVFYEKRAGSNTSLKSPNFDAFPTTNLVSISTKCDYWCFPLEMLQKFLVKSKRLQSLEIAAGSRYNGPWENEIPRVFTVENGMLPPVKHLTIRGVRRFRTLADICLKIWNFSKLESLHLPRHSGHYFLLVVPGQAISSLHSLHLEDTVGTPTFDDYGGHISLMGIKSCLEDIRSLVELNLKCYTPAEMIPLLLPHSQSLKILKLADKNVGHPSIGVDELTSIQTGFPNIYELHLDLDFPLFSLDHNPDNLKEKEKSQLFRTQELHIPSNCPNLHTLHIRPQATPSGPGDTPRKAFCDAVVRELTSHKQGKPFREVTFHWRCHLRRRNPSSHGPVLEFSVMRYQWNIYGENLVFKGSRGRKKLI